MRPITSPFAISLLAFALPVQADQVVSDDLVVGGRLCTGYGCSDGESFLIGSAEQPLKISADIASIWFDDTSGDLAPDRDWRLGPTSEASVLSAETFLLEDLTEGTSSFVVTGGAPDNALHIGSNGAVGLGTSIAETDLHVMSSGGASIRLETTGTFAGKWDVGTSLRDFFVRDAGSGIVPVRVEQGAPSGSIIVNFDGKIGLGTATPDGKLHTKGDGVQLVYFESSDGGSVQVRFRTDSENRRFLAVNNANEVKSQLIFLDNSIKLTGQTDSGANLWATISAAGIVTQGPICGSPCDATFDPETFTPPSIEDHAAFMWKNRFLKAVGPIAPDRPVNLTEKLGGVVHELEVAHIYIEELHERLAAQDAKMAAVLAHTARIEALAAQNADLAARLEELEKALN